jgi:acetyl esterase/lipase
MGLKGLAPAIASLFTSTAFVPIPPTRTVAYAQRARGVRPLVDIYLPDSDAPPPSVVLLHGGGFVTGSRSMKSVVYLATSLVERGFAVAAGDYRLIFRGGRLEEAVDDARTLVDWWAQNAAENQVDPSGISLLGMSAGATLATLAADPSTVNALVGIYGCYDFTNLPDTVNRMLLRTTKADEIARLSPVQRCSTAVPTLLMHGGADTLIDTGHTHRLEAFRAEQGLPTTVHILDGEPHGFFQTPERPACAPAVDIIGQFLENIRIG